MCSPPGAATSGLIQGENQVFHYAKVVERKENTDFLLRLGAAGRATAVCAGREVKTATATTAAATTTRTHSLERSGFVRAPQIFSLEAQRWMFHRCGPQSGINTSAQICRNHTCELIPGNPVSPSRGGLARCLLLSRHRFHSFSLIRCVPATPRSLPLPPT